MAKMFYGPEARLFQEIQLELHRSFTLHPTDVSDAVRRGAITIEEGLEATYEMVGRLMALQKTVLGATRVSSKEFSTNDLRKELIQTAAMCVKHLLVLKEDDHANEKQVGSDSAGATPGYGHGV